MERCGCGVGARRGSQVTRDAGRTGPDRSGATTQLHTAPHRRYPDLSPDSPDLCAYMWRRGHQKYHRAKRQGRARVVERPFPPQRIHNFPLRGRVTMPRVPPCEAHRSGTPTPARRPRTSTTAASSDNNVNREQRAKVWKCERKVRARLHRAWHGPDGVVWARYAAGGAGMCTVCMRGETCCESMRGVRLYAAGRAHVP